jgi:hypothetical protein
MVAAHPEHNFVLLRDRRLSPAFDYGPNCKQVWLLPPARRPWLYDLWFDWAVPRALRRCGAAVFVSPDGFASRRTQVPQTVVINYLKFLHRPDWLPASDARHYAARFPVYARSAAALLTVSEFSRPFEWKTVHNEHNGKKVNWERIEIYKVVVLNELIIFATDLRSRKCVFFAFPG